MVNSWEMKEHGATVDTGSEVAVEGNAEFGGDGKSWRAEEVYDKCLNGLSFGN